MNYEQATELEVSRQIRARTPRNGRSGTSQHGPGQAPFGILVSVANPTFSLTGVSLKEIEHPIKAIFGKIATLRARAGKSRAHA